MPLDAISIHHLAHKLYRWRVPLLPTLLDGVIFLLFNSVIHHSTTIGRNTTCAYRGMSVLIHKNAVIGDNVVIGAHAVIGGRSGHREVPIVEDGVYIGPNTSILGPIRLREGTVVGAGAVVINSTPARATVAGVPARVIRIDLGPGAGLDPHPKSTITTGE